MSKKSFRLNTIDGFVVLFIFFAIILSALLIYMQKIDQSIKTYHVYKDNIEEIILLDHKFDNFLLEKYHYLDYDTVKETTNRMHELFDMYLSNDTFQAHRKEREKIKSIFERKSRLIEDFKSLNSRMTNSMHYMYDLRKSISISEMDGLKKNISDEIFFNITQLIMDIPINRKSLLVKIHLLQSLVTEDCKCEHFLKQINYFLKDYDVMKGFNEENRNIGFSVALNKALMQLENQHSSDINKQKIIAFVFFGLAFLVLILLIINYRKVIKTSRELQAFRYAIENSDNIILITDPDRNITYVNEAFELQTGYQKYEVIGSQPNILKSNLMTREFYEEMNEMLEKGEKWQGELVNKRKDGSILYEKASISPITIDGEIVQYLAIKLDITDYIEYQNRLKQSATVFENTQEGILILNEEKQIDSANHAFLKMTDFEEEELCKKSLEFFASEKNDESFYEKIWSDIEERNEWSGKVYISQKKDKTIPIWLSLTTVRGKDDEIINYIAIYTDLSEVIRTQEKADFLAYHDSLTLLPNRAHFEKYIKNIFQNKNIDNKIAVIFLDLDRFKVINDTLGHNVGDELLKGVSQRILEVIDHNFFLARLGGDEFVIVLDEMNSKKEVSECAKRILEHINKLMVVDQHHLSVSASMGISLYPDHSDVADTLIRYADSAMYSAKESGKNRYVYYEEQMSLDVHTRLNLEQLLKTAYDNDEFSLVYQPQYNLHDHKVSGAEVLIRWHNSQLGKVSPDEFIPIAEDTGLIIDLGYYIFEEACKTFMEWYQNGCTLQKISINLSNVQLRQDDFLEKIEQIMEKTGIRGEQIEVELTERILFEFSSSNIDILDRFREMGCEISIDDFGTGYSSMSYLKDLPIDTVKIDKAFVDDLPYNIHDQKVAKAIIALSKSLGYKVIAEGIETKAQEKFLYDNNCDIGQGYHFSKPLDKHTFIKFVKEQMKKG